MYFEYFAHNFHNPLVDAWWSLKDAWRKLE